MVLALPATWYLMVPVTPLDTVKLPARVRGSIGLSKLAQMLELGDTPLVPLAGEVEVTDGASPSLPLEKG